ncbi:MAG: ArnT family glycosyltransferase [Planctomycetota bacterium]|jgi:hypothetical protein
MTLTSHHRHAGDLPAERCELTRRQVGLWLACLLVSATAMRLLEPVGWIGADDTGYHAAAEHVIAGKTIERVHHHFARSPVVIPAAMSMALLGNHVTAVILPSMLFSLLAIILVALLGRCYWGWRTGLTAGTIFAFIPILQNNATGLLPGSHTCCFVAGAMLMSWLAARAEVARYRHLLAIGAGVACAAAISTKLFAAAVLLGVGATFWHEMRLSRRFWMTAGMVGVGIMSFVILESAFFGWAADDFWYKARALNGARGAHVVEKFHSQAYQTVSGTVDMISHRLMMPYRLDDSTWGVMGMFFLPATVAALVCDRRAQGLGLWTLATFLGVGFVPISFDGGIHVFPPGFFDGVNLLVLCVPMSLCTAWAVNQLARRPALPRRLWNAWPVGLIVVMMVAHQDRLRCNRSRTLPQQEIGRAIETIIASDSFAAGRAAAGEPIYMLPSIYWRYRILFPEPLRSRLRVVASSADPDWWLTASADMQDRWEELPNPPRGYLLATPEQISGEGHYWDYGVGMPRDRLPAWQEVPTVGVVRRGQGGKMSMVGRAEPPNDPGGGRAVMAVLHPTKHHGSVQHQSKRCITTERDAISASLRGTNGNAGS